MNDNEKNELKTHLKEYCDSVLEPSKHGLYCCPFCGSGTGKHKTGAFSLYPKNAPVMYQCFSGNCGVTGDLFSLIMKIEGLDFKGALNRADELFGTGAGIRENQYQKYQYRKPEPEPKQLKPTPPCKQWQRAIIPIVRTAEKTLFEYAGKNALRYLTENRKIDTDTIRQCHIGYIPPMNTGDWFVENGYSFSIDNPIPNEEYKKLAIPIGITLPYFMDGQLYKLETRRLESQIHGDIDKIGQVRREAGIIKDAIFGGDYAACADNQVRDVMFVEGAIDALTVNQTVGRHCNNEIMAVTFGSSTTIGDPDTFYKHYVMPRRVIVAFDNDDAGRKSGALLAEQITRARRYAGADDARIAFPPERYNDWNDFLRKDKDSFFSYVSDLFPI